MVRFLALADYWSDFDINNTKRRMSIRAKLRKMDMFRKVPTELTEGSACGTFLTILCYMAVAILVVFELKSYMTVETKMEYKIQQHRDEFIRINFDITMTKLSCDYATLDIVNQMGTHKINITQNIRRWQVYDNGYMKEVDPDLSQDLGSAEKMKHEQYSVVIKTMDGFQALAKSSDILFVNFFAPWCHWCQQLAPIYEGLAQRVQSSELSNVVTIAKVDCTDIVNREVCQSNSITAYPTLIAFTPHNEYKYVHYHGMRSIDAFYSFLKDLVETNHPTLLTNNAIAANISAQSEGCRLKGNIVVPRMSGNFHISCHGAHSYLLPSEINVSHEINALSFGDILSPSEEKLVPKSIREGVDVLKHKRYSVFTTNTSYEHILKVFPTQINKGDDTIDLYQYTSDSGAGISDEDYPEATFSFDFHPLTIVMSDVKKPLYHFITSLFAIIGGVVCMISLIDGLFNRAEMIYQEKVSLGKVE